MIPLRFGSAAPFERAGGPKRGHVAVDFGESEVVELAVIDPQRRDELARVARQQLEAAGVGELAGERDPLNAYGFSLAFRPTDRRSHDRRS
jgi:hypothetical protein